MIAVNLTLLLLVFIALMKYQWQTSKGAFYASIATFGGALFAEYFFRKFRDKKMKSKS